MIRRAWIALPFMLAVLSACAGAADKASPAAVDGMVRLGDEDLRGSVNLAGQWELYWGCLLTPEDFAAGKESGLSRRLITVPGSWNGPEAGLPMAGYATYRLTVELPEDPVEPIGLYIDTTGMSFRLYCNDALMIENGSVSPRLADSRGSYAPQSVFMSAHGRLQIVFQIANFEFPNAGMIAAPRLGYQSSIAPLKPRDTLLEAVIYAAILAMGIYHILLSRLHPDEKASLFFGLLSIALSVRGVLLGARILHQLIGAYSLHSLTVIEFIADAGCAYIAYLYFHHLFPNERPRFVLVPLTVITAAFCVVFTLLPIWLLVEVNRGYEAVLLTEGIIILAWIFRALRHRREGALLLLIGFLALLGGAVNDIVLDVVRRGGVFIASYMMVAFIVLQAIVIARRYARAFYSAKDSARRAEALADSYGRFVPREFLDLLGKESIDHVGLGDQVERNMTVLFVKIHSFTALSAKMSPAENFSFLNSYLMRVSPVVKENRGFIDRHLGDGFIALFGDSPADGLHAAARMREALREYNSHREKSGYTPIAIGIGADTGRLMLGTVGESSRMEATVVSHAVNLASRLEELTRVFGSWLIMSGDVIEACPDAGGLPCRRLGCARVRSTSRPLRFYEILDTGFPERAETRGRFQAALESYEKRLFGEAMDGFRGVLAADPEDTAARFYLDRISGPSREDEIILS